MADTNYRGIDYGMGNTNIDKANGIRFGVIPFHDVLQAWSDSSEAEYPEPEIEIYEDGEEIEAEDYMMDCEPLGFSYSADGYKAYQSSESPDIFITKSPFYTRAQFCSPCAPGACYLRNPCPDGERAYCFGADWFDSENPCPYPIWRVSDDTLVYSPSPDADAE